ncbi:MAG: hypothetical protein PUE64_11940 [Firmicutes bacterium]|jgi:hypothetical protein|nr:hypothetical protein [Bacillota bacterium]
MRKREIGKQDRGRVPGWRGVAALALAVLTAFALPLGAEAAARKTVFIGDSRTVGYYVAGTGGNAVSKVCTTDGNGDFWVARTGQGIDWAQKTAVPKADSKVGADTDVIFCIGINDTFSTKGRAKTVKLVNQKAAAWKERGARTFFVSILPIKSDGEGYTNKEVTAWNTYLRENLSEDVYWIDLVTPTSGILQYADRFHFQYTTYRMIYQYLKIVAQYTAAVEDGQGEQT